jgi:hypothetical protein
MSNIEQNSVEWLAEKYNYVTWMRNRDEISAGMADEWRKHYLEQAKAKHKDEIINAIINNRPKPCEGKIIKIEGVKYKLTKV